MSATGVRPAAATEPAATERPAPAPTRPAIARRHPRRDWVTRRALALADLLGLGLGLALALLAGIGDEMGRGRLHDGQPLLVLAALPLFVAVFRAQGLYERDVRRISHTTVDDVPALAQALLTSIALLWIGLRLAGQEPASYGALLAFGVLGGVLVLALRACARVLLRAALGPERVLLVGDGPEIPLLARKLRAHPEYGVEAVGVVSGAAGAAPCADVPLVSAIAALDLEREVRERGVERVILARLDDCPAARGGDEADPNRGARLELLRRCKELSLRVGVVPQLHDALGPSVVIDDVEGITVLDVPVPVLSRSSRVLKRAMDVVGAALGLVLAAPLLAALALAIKLDSRGPVLFRQRRVGQWGRPFRIVKLRTMVRDAERRQAELRARSSDPGWLLIGDDPRVTRVGRVLRSTSLDELPQLWNVLRGEMSLVGPRPLIESEDVQLEGWRRSRVDLRPGLTGLWQILGRTGIPFDEMVKLDYLYVTNWSLWNDVRLLLRTVPAVLTRRGSN